MGRSRWTHLHTVCLVDCLHEDKRSGYWDKQQRLIVHKKIQQRIQASEESTPKSIHDIETRIRTVGRGWTIPRLCKKNETLYHYGWAAMRPECSRDALLSDPHGTHRPSTAHESLLEKPVEECSRIQK